MRRRISQLIRLTKFCNMRSSLVRLNTGHTVHDSLTFGPCCSRISDILPCCRDIRDCHDIPSRPYIREEESADLYFDLLHRWFCFRHVCQSFWHCPEAYPRGPQPIHPCFDIRVPHRYRLLHSHADELLQQGLERVLHLNVCNPTCKYLTYLTGQASIPCTMSHSPPPHSAPHSSCSKDSIQRMPSIPYRYFAVF